MYNVQHMVNVDRQETTIIEFSDLRKKESWLDHS